VSDRLVVVSAGTYHLPFDRLSVWVQQWSAARGDVRVVMQHGPSQPVRGAENIEILPYDELLSLCRDADVVVLQGGAGGVMDMRALGIVPIVVPRVPGGGEVVDDHQLVFTREMADLGIIRRATTLQEFTDALDAELASPSVRGDAGVATPGVAVLRAVLERPIRPLPLWHRLRRLARTAVGVLRAKLGR